MKEQRIVDIADFILGNTAARPDYKSIEFRGGQIRITYGNNNVHVISLCSNTGYSDDLVIKLCTLYLDKQKSDTNPGCYKTIIELKDSLSKAS